MNEEAREKGKREKERGARGGMKSSTTAFLKLHEPKATAGGGSSLGDDHTQERSSVWNGLLIGCLILWCCIVLLIAAMVVLALYFSGAFGPVEHHPPPPPAYPTTF